MVMKLFLKLAGVVLPQIIDLLSPMIRTELGTLLRDLYEKALLTDNPWDDYGIEFLAQILAIELPELE